MGQKAENVIHPGQIALPVPELNLDLAYVAGDLGALRPEGAHPVSEACFCHPASHWRHCYSLT
jgi:hypothetical protein